MQISRISQHNFNTLPAKGRQEFAAQQQSPSFTGGNLPPSKFFDPLKKFFKPVTDAVNKTSNTLVDGIAHGFAKVSQTDTFKKMVAGTAKNKIDVVKHISAAIALMISGLYIKRTLSNDKLAPEQKTTLAINQGIVSVVATSLGYCVNGMAAKKIDKFVRKYAAVNYKDPQLKSLKMGVNAATSMVIFATMYRYVSPVLVTPIANAIGNKVQANKKKAAELAKAQQVPAQAKATVAPTANKVA